MTDTVPPRSFSAHLELRAQNATPRMLSGLYDSAGEFLVLEPVNETADRRAGFETFQPSQGNEWLTPEQAAAIAYRPAASVPTDEYPFALAVFVEGDVTRYRFARFNDAARAGRLWAVGR